MNEALRAIEASEGRLHMERRVVRFQEVDAAGILFYARTFDFFHDAYVAFLRVRGVPLEAALRDGGWVAPLRHAEAEYLRPLRFGDAIDVSLVRIDVGDTHYSIGYRIELDGHTACVGRTHHVTVDPATFRRAPIPPALREALRGGSG
jgi:YbgC/YbaW family acyl-CoA thioester hydrolase